MTDKKHLNKQMVQGFQVLRNVYILNVTCHHMPKYFQVSDENHPNKHILVLRHAKHHTLAFSHDEGYLGPSIFEEWKKNILSFAEYIFFAPDEGFFCWIAGGGAQNVWTNILIFKFIVLRLVIYSVSGTTVIWVFFIDLGCIQFGRPN